MRYRDLRNLFLEYFKKRKHHCLPSSSLIPKNDSSLLFVNAGMNAFKSIFLGSETTLHKRVVTIQRCLRVGGKHNDLESVGKTDRHLTFFEMMGNFSFGDYFKREAIEMAWDFSTRILGIDSSKIWVSVFADDHESYDIWSNIVGDRVVYMGEEDNFWSMGIGGPCGPSSELYYDRGVGEGSLKDDPFRFLEFWNLVFISYNRVGDQLIPLEDHFVDTGMGLERLLMILSNLDSPFKTELFMPSIKRLEELSGSSYDDHRVSFHIIVDHMRSILFTIVDGLSPSNVDRGYILRKLIRRALSKALKLGMQSLSPLIDPLVKVMGDVHKEIISESPQVYKILKREEEIYLETLSQAEAIFEKTLSENGKISGEDLFILKDRHGISIDLLEDLLEKNSIEGEWHIFHKLVDGARKLSREAKRSLPAIAPTRYDLDARSSTILAIYKDGALAEQLTGEGEVILDVTPFRAAAGGEVGDRGILSSGELCFKVSNVINDSGLYIHKGFSNAPIRVGDSLSPQVDVDGIDALSINHSATHLLHWALHRVLGDVKQEGSMVGFDGLRFDYAGRSASSAEIIEIERLVNEEISKNHKVVISNISRDNLPEGTLAFFDDKYGKIVRLVEIGESKELCGGRHVSTSGEIDIFRITKSNAIAKGIRRVEGVTGPLAKQLVLKRETLIKDISSILCLSPDDLPNGVRGIIQDNKRLNATLKKLSSRYIRYISRHLATKQIGKYQVVIDLVKDLDDDQIKLLGSRSLASLDRGIVILSTDRDGMLYISLSSNGIDVKKIINAMLSKWRGNGGGSHSRGIVKIYGDYEDVGLFLEEMISSM